MKIPFDIKHRDKIESGEYKVETRGGRPARIICWDKESILPIVALVKEITSETVVSFTENGDNPGGFKCYDLFIITPEPEMSEFEQEVYKMTTNKVHFKEEANKLLDLAKQQLLQSGELLTQEHHEKLMETLREECKKDLPRWKNVEADKRYVGCVTRYMDVNGDWNYCMSSGMLSNDCQYISIAALEKLPKEDESYE